MPPPPPEQFTESPTGQRMIDAVNDPRVSGFLRFLNVLTGGITLAAVLALGSTAASWQGSLQRLTWLVEQLNSRVSVNEKENENQDRLIREMKIDVEVHKKLSESFSWRLGRLERRNGL